MVIRRRRFQPTPDCVVVLSIATRLTGFVDRSKRQSAGPDYQEGSLPDGSAGRHASENRGLLGKFEAALETSAARAACGVSMINDVNRCGASRCQCSQLETDHKSYRPVYTRAEHEVEPWETVDDRPEQARSRGVSHGLPTVRRPACRVNA